MTSLQKVSGILVFSILIGFSFFTNCARNPESASVPDTAFVSPNEKHLRLKSLFKNQIPTGFCSSDSSYACQRKVYSAQITNGIAKNSQECTALGESLQICPTIQTLYFNTEAAQLHCQGCEETYEYLEYSCHLKLANQDGLFPAVATQPTLHASLYELHQFCTSIASRSIDSH